MRAAVIGGGVFGCTIAVDLARAGAKVDLFEARPDILDGATARCQARLHRGYHYPRSDSTAAAARDGFDQFQARYGSAVRFATGHHYVIAPDSWVSPADYLAFLDRLDLPYEVVEKPPHVHTADLVVRVPEAFVDVAMLRRLLRRDLAMAGVAVLTNAVVGEPEGYDLVVRATYGQPWLKPLRYELCEVALLELGRYAGESYVVLDGEYVSLDPHGRLYALYDVKHSVHAAVEGEWPVSFPDYEDLLYRWGPCRTSLSNLDAMVESASRFLWGLRPDGQGVSIYHGSTFAVRAVLPDVDATDERPTLVERTGDTIWVLSGKICTAVDAARRVVEMALGPYATGGVVHGSDPPAVIQPCELVVMP